MPKFKLVALSNAVQGTDDEFRQWYEQHHLKDVAAIPGVVGASFLRSVAGNDRWQYLAIYDVDADDVMVVLAEIGRRSGTEQMQISPTLAKDDVFFGAFGGLAPTG